MKPSRSRPPRRAKARPAKKANTDWATRLIKSVWPQERDFFERPDRYRYVRRLLPEAAGCVFCEAAASEPSVDSLVLARDQHVVVVMNKYPYNTGHVLVVPARHTGDLWSLSDPENARVAWWLREAARTLREVLDCQGFNLGLNHGSVAGAGIPDHLHWHVVPRWGGDTNFFPLIAETKALPETLQQTYNRLRPSFAKIG